MINPLTETALKTGIEGGRRLASKPEDDTPLPLYALNAFSDTIDAPGSSVRRLLAGKNPFGAITSIGSQDDHFSGRDLLRSWGFISDEDTYANYLAGLGTEILTDPTTYLTAGIGGVAKGLATNAAKSGVKAALKDSAVEAGRRMSNSLLGGMVKDTASGAKNFVKTNFRDQPIRAAEDAMKFATASAKSATPLDPPKSTLGELLGGSSSLAKEVQKRNHAKLKSLYDKAAKTVDEAAKADAKEAFKKELNRQGGRAAATRFALNLLKSPIKAQWKAGIGALGAAKDTGLAAFGQRGIENVPQGVELLNQGYRQISGLNERPKNVDTEYTDEEIEAMTPEEILQAIQDMGYGEE